MARRIRVLVAGLALLAVIAALAYDQNPLTRAAQAHAESVAKVSAATYVSLRALNAFLSTAQEIELGGSLVVSGSAQPLKILEPIDDTIERIAGLIFMLMAVSGVLAVAMGPVGGIGWALVALAALVWFAPRSRVPGLRALVQPMGSYGLFLGLALPLAFVLAATFADRMTERTYARHNATIAELTTDIAPADVTAETTAWQDIDRYRRMAGTLYSQADTLIASYLAILAVFVFRIFVFPLVLLGLFFAITRHFARDHDK